MQFLSFSPDGKTLAAAGIYRTVTLWDAATGKERATINGHKTELSSIAWSPDGKTLATASFDNTIKLWDVTPAK